MSTRLLPTISVFVAAIFYLHLAYLLNFEPAFGYPQWLRIRVGLRLVGTAGASIRMLAAGDFDISRHCDKLGAILSGCGCALMSILSLPIRAPIHPDKVAHLHEIASAFPSIFVSHFIHWVLGLSFGLAFLAYTFPVLVALPSDRTEASLFARMVTWADRFACTGWGLTLLCKDTNWAYWKAQGVEFWLHNTNILAEVITIASLVVGASLPWIGKVTNAEHRKKE